MSRWNRGWDPTWDRSSSLMPRILGNDYWDLFDYPTSLVNQDFGDILDPFTDVFEPLTSRPTRYRPYTQSLAPALDYDYDWPLTTRRNVRQQPLQQQQSQTGMSRIENDADKFCVALDCRQFNPEELDVTYGDNNTIEIHGKHEERGDEHGYVSREFKRRYVLPQNCEMDKVNAQLNENGQLCITCPKKPQQQQIGQGKKIPITGGESRRRSVGQGAQQQQQSIQQQQQGHQQQGQASIPINVQQQGQEQLGQQQAQQQQGKVGVEQQKHVQPESEKREKAQGVRG